MTRTVVSLPDDALTATVVRSLLLRYRDGADAALDRPAHVRAASGLAWVGSRLAVIQDDTNFVALVDPTDGGADAVPLPAGPGGVRQFDDGRGNKAHKLDLEAVVSVPAAAAGGSGEPLVVAFGSGSSPRRERVVVCHGLGDRAREVRVDLHDARDFYAGLRAAADFAGSELNVEGAVYLGGGRLRLFGRGNGAPRDGVLPVDATCDVDWPALAAHLGAPGRDPPPVPTGIVQYDLGAVGGVALTFTDAARGPGDAGAGTRWTVYTAAAEASPDATRDGPVAGAAIGVIAERSSGTAARWALLRDAAGEPFAGKAEGIVLAPGDPTRAYVVVDRDAYDAPSQLCEVALGGPWFALDDGARNSR